jgi:hypothetical protein
MKTALAFCAACLLLTSISLAADPPEGVPDKAKLIALLEKTLTGCKMTGKFTTTGQDKDKDPAADSYQITKAMKLDEGDTWLITAKMGDKSLPVPVDIVWSGDTPVITLTNVTIPGMGAGFSCRILIYDGLYAGTWGHGKVTGHMWGKIEPAEKK